MPSAPRCREARRAPFPGLEPFQEDDTEVYFGSEDEVGAAVEMVNRVRRLFGSRAVVVVGASGVGKSSFVRAGISPRIRSTSGTGSWLVPFVPVVTHFSR